MENYFYQDITRELGLENLPEEKREEILLRVGKIIFQGIILKTVDLLSEEEQDDLNILLDQPENENKSINILDFLRSKIASLDEIIATEIINFKKEANIIRTIDTVKT